MNIKNSENESVADYITTLRAIRDTLFMLDAQYGTYDAVQTHVVESALNTLRTEQYAQLTSAWQFEQRLLFALSIRVSDIACDMLDVYTSMRALSTLHDYVRTAYADSASFEVTLSVVYWQLENALQLLENELQLEQAAIK